jgi:exonuclease-1
MGIQGLHRGLSFATKKTTLQEFSGKTLAIDSSSWLHRSVYSISEKYVEALERGHVDQQCVRVSAHYVTSRCRELLDAFRIAKVFLVMDGKRCPLKTDTNEERERRRQANLSEARDYQRCGRKDKAEEKYKACIKIKDDFTVAVMGEVRRHFANDSRVQLVWSPYEADAQLTKLCVDGAAHAVITEVSLKRTTNCKDIHAMTHQSLF